VDSSTPRPCRLSDNLEEKEEPAARFLLFAPVVAVTPRCDVQLNAFFAAAAVKEAFSFFGRGIGSPSSSLDEF
jgi:hypothetical protein